MWLNLDVKMLTDFEGCHVSCHVTSLSEPTKVKVEWKVGLLTEEVGLCDQMKVELFDEILCRTK